MEAATNLENYLDFKLNLHLRSPLPMQVHYTQMHFYVLLLMNHEKLNLCPGSKECLSL